MSQELEAHVEGGRIVLDQPVSLPEGTRLRVRRLDVEDVEPAVELAIEEGFADFEDGQFDDAREFARRLSSRS